MDVTATCREDEGLDSTLMRAAESERQKREGGICPVLIPVLEALGTLAGPVGGCSGLNPSIGRKHWQEEKRGVGGDQWRPASPLPALGLANMQMEPHYSGSVFNPLIPLLGPSKLTSQAD